MIFTGIDMSDSSKMTFAMLRNFTRSMSNIVIETPAVRDILINKQFDAVVTEWFFTDTEAG